MLEQMKVNRRVCAVIVTYYPDNAAIRKQLEAISDQVSHIMIIDNTQEEKRRLVLPNDFDHISIVYAKKNIGLSKAQNMGIQWALDHTYDYILLLDQDSLPEEKMVDKLVKTHEHLQGLGVHVSSVGPRYARSSDDHASYFLRFGKSYFHYNRIDAPETANYAECSFLISSGMLISAASLHDIGLMDETLFIDHIDSEWHLRALGMGYTPYGVYDAFMTHSLGERIVRVWAGYYRQLSIHRAFRLYYIFRNSLLLYRRSYIPTKWKILDAKRLIFFPFLYLLFSTEKISSVKHMALGIWHGLRGKGGKL
ncbi:MAG: glycosyltransferase family 2 protein [Mariprofundaceae bacterium]